MSAINSQLGCKIETTYGTDVVVDRFWSFTNASLKTKQQHLDGEGLRAAGIGLRSDQVRVHNQGGEVDLEMEWMTKGMGWWLLPMQGALATGAATDSAYPHTGTMATTYGDFFTAQVNMPLHPAGTDQAITLCGVKVLEWELSCDMDGKVMFKPKLDVREIDTSVGLASASYVASAVPYDWVDVSITLGGSALPVTGWTLKCNNNLDTERYHQQASAFKSEPTRKGHPVISFEFDKDFEALATVWNRVRASVAANSMAQLVVTMSCSDTGQTIGSATQPSTVITIPKLRLDDIDGLTVSGPDHAGIKSKGSGLARYDGSNNLMTILYTSSDSTA